MVDNPSQVFNSQKSNPGNVNIPSQSFLPTTEVISKDETLIYDDVNYKTLQQMLNTHYNLNLGCDKNDALKTDEKGKVVSCKKEVDASSDEGETYGLLNI